MVEKNRTIEDLKSGKNNLRNRLKAIEDELVKSNQEQAILKAENSSIKASYNHLANTYDELYFYCYDEAKSRSLKNWITFGCLAVSIYIAYRGSRPPKTDLPELPPKKFSLIENFFLYFTDVENQ